MELEMGKKILKENPEIKLILINSGEIVYKSTARGITPMYDIAINHVELAKGGIVLDRVIGRGAAIIASYIEVGEVYGELMSSGAKGVLKNKNIKYSYLKETPYIKNRIKSDYCPIEKLSMGIEDGEVLLEKVGKFLEEINS